MDVDAIQDDGDQLVVSDERAVRGSLPGRKDKSPAAGVYVALPVVFLLVTLLGGLRLAAGDNAFLFVTPPLICLVLAAFVIIVMLRSGLIEPGGWLSGTAPVLETAANAGVLVTLFTATVQMLNSLLPEQGLPFVVIGFCFFWTLWTNLFAELTPRKLVRSFGALFAMAFVIKYLVLANLAASPDGHWLERMIENPTKEAFTWLLDLPRYSAGTGYIQFFTLVLYMIGLYLTPRVTK